MRRRRRGANGRGRTGKERKGKGRTYTSRGETEKYWAMFYSHIYLFAPVLVCVREAFAVFRALLPLPSQR